jgi:hypothetical protein
MRGSVLTVALALAGSQVAAQQVEVRVVVPQQTAKEIRAAIEKSIEQAIDVRVLNEISREISDALRESLAGAGVAARAVSEALRESSRHVPYGAWDTPGGVRQDKTFTQEQTAKETLTLAIGPNGTLTLKNIAGDITVTGGGGKSATVEVLRRSRGRTDADAKLGLERVKVAVDHRGERATVEAQYPDHDSRPPYAVSVAYVVTAPTGTTLSITTLSGDVLVKDIKGDVSASLTAGDATVSGSRVSSLKTLSGTVAVTDAEADSAMDLTTLSGDIRLERAKARRVMMSTLNGDVVARDVDTASAVMTSTSGNVEFTGAPVKGGRYELRAHSGDVKVILPKGGFDVSARTFSGRITADPSLGLQTTTSRPRSSSLRGTVGDGSATFDVSTFSGDVTISRK